RPWLTRERILGAIKVYKLISHLMQSGEDHGVAHKEFSLAHLISTQGNQGSASNRLSLFPAKVLNSLCDYISAKETTAINHQTPGCVRSTNLSRNLGELKARRRNDDHVALADALFRGRPKFD